MAKNFPFFVAPKLQSNFYDSKNNYVTNATTHANQCGANTCLGKIWLAYTLDSWRRGSVVERQSLAGELSLSCARPAADG